MKKMDEEAARRLYEEGFVDAKIGARLGVSESTVYNWRKREGLPPHGRKTAHQVSTGSEAVEEKESFRKMKEEAERILPQAEYEKSVQDAERSEREKGELVERIEKYIERGMRQIEEAKSETESAGEILVLSGKYRALSDLRDEIRLLRVLEESGI